MGTKQPYSQQKITSLVEKKNKKMMFLIEWMFALVMVIFLNTAKLQSTVDSARPSRRKRKRKKRRTTKKSKAPIPTLKERKEAKSARAFIFTSQGETPEMAVVMDKPFSDSLDEFYGTVTKLGKNSPDDTFRSYLMFDIMDVELEKLDKYRGFRTILKTILRLTLTVQRDNRWRVDTDDSERAQELVSLMEVHWRKVFARSNKELDITGEDREGLLYYMNFFKKVMSDCPCGLEFSTAGMS